MAASEAGASAVVLFERADTECYVIRKVGGLGREPLGVGVLSVICTPTPDGKTNAVSGLASEHVAVDIYLHFLFLSGLVSLVQRRFFFFFVF